MYINDILEQRGLQLNKTKLARHAAKEDGLARLIYGSREKLEEWQGIQRSPVFDPCDYVVAFVNLPKSRARLVGVYEKEGDTQGPFSAERCLSNGIISRELFSVMPRREKERYVYKLARMPEYDDLQGYVIYWGKSRMWHQWAHKQRKEIISEPAASQ